MNRVGSLAVLSSAILVAGCFEVEQSITINADMSGRAAFVLGVDMEPMVVIMAGIQREMQGKSGPPTPVELQQARMEFLEKTQDESSDPASEFETIRQSMPSGIDLLHMSAERTGLEMVSRFLFSFDHVSRVGEIELPANGAESPATTNVMPRPFDGLELVDQGSTFLIRTRPQNPVHAVEEEARQSKGPADEALEAMLRNAMKGLRISYRIEAPFEVVEHNATRVEGRALIWEFDLERLEALEATGEAADLHIRVRYRKEQPNGPRRRR